MEKYYLDLINNQIGLGIRTIGITDDYKDETLPDNRI